MIVLGALINGLEAAAGGIIGLLFKRHVSQKLGDFLLEGQGLCCLLVGVQGMVEGGNVSVVTLSLALGCAIGYALDIDAWVRRLGDKVQARLNAAFAGSSHLGSFSEGFVNATLFCCTGAMAIVGSLASGIQLDPSTLIAKGVIDLVVCIPMAATLGIGVPFVGVSLLVYEGILSLAASAVAPLLSDAVVTEMAVTGSLLLLVVGTNLMKITTIKVANMLPSCFLPMALVPLMGLFGVVA